MQPRDRVIALSALTAVAFSVLALGGVLRWTQAVTALVIAVGVATTALSHRSFARFPPLVALLGAAAGLTALQLVPLPDAIAHLLVPSTGALRAHGAELLGVSPWTAATSDAGATLAALIMLLTLLGLAVIALRIATSERGRYRIVASVGALCGLIALVGGLHRLFGLTALYGLYEPEYVHPRILAPLLNGNTLACLMAMGASLAIGLAAHRNQPSWLRASWLLVIVACGAVVVATISRGGTLALIAGSLVTVAIIIGQRLGGQDRSRKRRARFLTTALPLGVLVGCLTVLVIYSNAGNVERQLSQLSFEEVHYSRSKFAAWQSATTLVAEQPWLGVGRGGFEGAFTRVHEASGLATYSHLENEYLQAVVDWGVPGALLLAGLAVWLAYVAIRRWRDSALTAGVIGALTVVAAQSNVDFGLEFLGIAAPVTVLLAAVTHVPLHESTRPLRARAFRIAHAAILLVGAVLLLTSLTTTLDEDRRALSGRVSLARVRESVTRHPLDYYGYAVAAGLMAQAGDHRAILLLNQAMALHPTHPHLHRMAARMLYADGFVAQSALEYAATLRTTTAPRPLLAEILDKFPRDQAATALPVDYADPHGLVHTLAELGHPDVARVWLGRVLALRPKTSYACELMFTMAQGGDIEAAEIAGQRCMDRLPDYLTRLSLARTLSQKQSYTEAIRLLQDVESWQSRRDDKIDAWLVLCDAHLALGYADESKRCLRRLDASADMLNERRGEIIKRIEAINNPPLATGSAAAP